MNQNSTIEVPLVSGLTADTPLLIGDEYRNIRSIFLSAGTALPTFGLDPQLVPVENKIASVPKEVYVSELWDIGFENGCHITCTPSTLVLMQDGYKPVNLVKPGEFALGMFFIQQKIQGSLIKCTVSDRVVKALKEPVYYFITETTNVLIPRFEEDIERLSFICIQQ